MIECTRCGALAKAGCNCGAPYVPAGTRAAEAVAANPEKSDRAIADDIGVSPTTVGKARKATVHSGQLQEQERIGKDGKCRKMPTPATPPTDLFPGPPPVFFEFSEVINNLFPKMDSITLAAAKELVAEWGEDEDEDEDEDEPEAEPAPTRHTVKFYMHNFEDGTCHLLPKSEDYVGPEWAQWRADHPDQWQWRELEVDAEGHRIRDAKGRPVRPGPWFNPDGTKFRPVDLTAALKSRRPSKRQREAIASFQAERERRAQS